ncbi:glycosyltransferase family A protein [Caldivirga sp. UBA161]|uniref:glycosyltransferase family A protein n=1 Tax=Caldivirga sp. UBA161 TaxID=1915569 RepID=UPI0025B86B67|nr:glycosyltransferase family 2 protein [Caldivirga sp. UBA161]
MSAVLALITKNGSRKGVVFRRMMESTLQIPYRSVILIDDSDNDETRLMVKDFTDSHGKELYASRSKLYNYHKPTRATGRQTAIDLFLSNFSEDILIQLDDDVILRDGWWSEALHAFTDDSVGMFYGITYDVNSIDEINLKHVTIDGKRLKSFLTTFLERGRTNDIALRRDALKAIRENYGIIPPELHLYEDAWLMRALQCLGWSIFIGFTGAIQHDPVKMSQVTAGIMNASIDIKYIKIASRYGVIMSINVADDVVKLLSPIALAPILAIRRMMSYGFRRGLSMALTESYVKLLYKYAKVKGSLGFSCSKLKYSG